MKVIIADTETTNIDEPELVEVAYLLMPETPMGMFQAETAPGKEIFCQRYNPGNPIQFGAMAVHHITDEDVVGCPPSSEFRLPEGTSYLVGHNIDFDWNAFGKPDIKRICTLALSRHLWPEVDSHKLLAMIYYLESGVARKYGKSAHSAKWDVYFCWYLLWHIVQEAQPESWDALWQLSEFARIPTKMTVGKHKGTPIQDLPRDYIQWFMRQPDVDPYLAKAFHNAINIGKVAK